MIDNINIDQIHTFNIDIKNREIFLHSYLSDSAEEQIDYKCSVVFEKNLRFLNQISNDPILVHMHLPGGDWQDGLGMYDAISYSKSKIIILAYAKVESCSSVLLQAAPVRVLMPNTNMLIHYGSISINEEHTKAASSSIAWNDRETDKMVDIFTDRCMETSVIAKEKNWKKMMAKKHIVSQLANKCDWILTAEETVYYGFADGILGSKQYPTIDSLKINKRK
jgi:ATP-dependent protease ClpP protease subunit